MKYNLGSRFVENGLVLPYKDNDSWGSGGVLDVNGDFVEESIYKDWATFGEIYEFDGKSVVDTKLSAIWMGKLNEHWGHFLLDDVTRLWYILNHYNGEYLIYVSKGKKIDGNFLDFITALGIPESKLIRVSKVTRFSKIIIPSSSKNEGLIYPEYFDIFNKVSSYFLSKKRGVEFTNKVYLSRGKFKGAQKKEIGESQIESLLIKQGYLSICPETLSLEEQVILWNYSRKIICFNGTLPLNIVFNQNGNLELVVLNKTSRAHQNLTSLLNEKKTVQVEYINIYHKYYDKYVRYLGEGPFILSDTVELLRYLGSSQSKAITLRKYLSPSSFMFFLFSMLKRNVKSLIK